MMKRLLTFLLGTMLLASCEKDAQKSPEPDFELRLTKIDAAGVTRSLIVDRAINVPGSAVTATSYILKQGSIELNMGLIPSTTIVPKLKGTIVFKQTSNPAATAGTYRLPDDAAKIHFSLAESIDAQTVIRDLAVSGTIEVNYNASNKTLSGKLINIQYNAPSGSVHKEYVLNGWFNHAAVAQ
jgi:hypothetical protein